MKIYTVGGAVRDELLGLPVVDRDHVVVGATPQAMVAAGYRPVGKDFPVFLHPQTHEEYALARTERKTARGYHGFVFHATPEVTLEEDLARRDLTINAMAKDDHGELIDPFGGAADIQARVLRHISPAFAEDPVRILRLARFAARFASLAFTVADETLTLLRGMVAAGEADALVAERVWQELSRGLMALKPSRMFHVLRDCGALARVLPEVAGLAGVPQCAERHPEIDSFVHAMQAIDYAAARGYALDVRFAALTHDLGKGATPGAADSRHAAHEAHSVDRVVALCERLRVPTACRDLARVMAKQHSTLHRAAELGPAALVDVLQSADAFRKPQRFERLMQACESDQRGRPGGEHPPYPPAARMMTALKAAAAVEVGAIARQQTAAAGIKAAVHQARVAAVRAALQETPD